MADRFIVPELFNRVAAGVTEIEESSLALFGLVVFYYTAFNIEAFIYNFLNKVLRIPVFKPFKERSRPDTAVFDNLAHTVAEIMLRQRAEDPGVDNDKARLMKGSAEILALRQINGGLASHRGIDLREQRRRYLDVLYASEINSRRKARHIAAHASAERNNRVLARESALRHMSYHLQDGLGRF